MNTSPYWNTNSFNSYDAFGPLNAMNQQYMGFNQNMFTQGFNPGGYNDMWGPLRDLSSPSQMGNATSFPGVPSNLPALPAGLPYMDPGQLATYLSTGQVPSTTSTTTNPATATPTPEMTAARTLILANSGGKLVDAQLSQVARTMDANGDGTQELVFQYGTAGSALKYIPGSAPGTEKDFEELFAQAMAATTKSASKTVSGALSTLEIVGSGTDAATNNTYYIIKITNAPLTTPAA